MFSRAGEDLPDHSLDLREREDWNPGILRKFSYAVKVTAFCYEAVTSILAIGKTSEQRR
jgi:hypothetical protein